MAQDYRGSIERLRRRLELLREAAARADDQTGLDDADALLRYSYELDALGQAAISEATHQKYLMRLETMARKVGGLNEALEDEAVAKRVNGWINSTYENPESNKTARDSVRSFGEHLTPGDGKPDSIEWIPTGYPENYDRTPDPAKMYRWDDHVLPILDACRNYRDEALIALAFDIGPRSGELQSLTVGDIAEHDWGIQVTVDGKQGRRSPVLMQAPTRVRRWVQDHHPDPDDPDAPLWSKLDRAEEISYRMFLNIFEEAVDRAPITPPSKPKPTRFRKSSVSHLARRGVSQVALENRYGWVRGSDEAARYIAVFGSESEREIASALGIDVGDEEPEPMGPLTCPQCTQSTPRDKDRCVWCGQALSPAAADEARAKKQEGLEALAELISGEGEVDRGEAVDAIDGLLESRVQAILDRADTH